jgi:6-phosphogluconolactonase (cycloisomerase 2 family)
MTTTTTLVWDAAVSQALNTPQNDGQEGVEIYGDFLYATDFTGSHIDVYRLDSKTGALTFASAFGTLGTGVGQFGEFSPVDMSFFKLSDGRLKAYVPEAVNQKIVVLDVDTTTGALSWDSANTLSSGQAELTTPYGIEIHGDFAYATDYGGSNIDIYKINRDTGALTFVNSYGSEGSGVDQFSHASPVDMSFFKLPNGATKAYVPDAENQRIVVLTVDTQTGALSWDAELTLANGQASSTLQYSLEIEDNMLYVTDYGGHNIDLYEINPQTGAIAYSHSIGSEGSEDNQFITPVDLSFYTTADGITRAYVPDSGNRRIAALTVSRPELTASTELIKVGGQGTSQLTLSLVESHTADISEIVVISTDSADGKINGVGIEDVSYLMAAIARSQVVFSVLDQDSAVPGLTLERVLDVTGGQYLNFAVLQGGSLQDALAHPDQVKVSYGSQLLGAGLTTTSTAGSNGPGSYIGLQAAGLSPLTNYADVVDGILIKAQLGDRDRPLGSTLQTGGADSELIDLTNEDDRLMAEFEVYREAIYENVVGFFAVENALGEVLDEMGTRLAPGDEGYIKAALSQRIAVNLTSQNHHVTRYSAEIQGGQLLSSFIIVGGTVEDLQDAFQEGSQDESGLADPAIFFTHLGANSDGKDHVRLLGDNTFGFEDTTGGGDQDFDDVVVKARFV